MDIAYRIPKGQNKAEKMGCDIQPHSYSFGTLETEGDLARVKEEVDSGGGR
jgi:hypothetical protein